MPKYALLLLIVTIVFLLVLFKTSDNFAGNSSGENNHSDFITDRLKTYGNIGMNLIASSNDGIFGESANPIAKTFQYPDQDSLFKKRSNLFRQIDICESIKTVDCGAFDNPDFSLDCGMCLDIGKNSNGAAVMGGLVLLPGDKEVQRKNVKENTIPDYIPTVGFCPNKKMVSTKKECLRLQRELLCKKNNSFDVDQCSQCATSAAFNVIDTSDQPDIISNSGVLVMIGSGSLNVIEQGGETRTISLSNKPTRIPIKGPEGTRIILELNDTGSGAAYVAGYITGIVYNGDFKADLLAIAINDQVTGRKPRMVGATKINKFPVKRMGFGYGKNTMSAVLVIPFSFVEPTMEEVKLCKNGPFLTKAASAQQVKSSPCFQPDSGPGKFSQACLQEVWLANSCNESGSGFPNNSVKATFLMADNVGQLRSTNDISNFIYKKAVTAITRYDENGNVKSISDWDKDSMFCLGRPIKSTCDFLAPGPRDDDCIVYIWKDMSKGNWCTNNGSLSPLNPDGSRNKENIQFWKSFGAEPAIRDAMNDVFNQAVNQENSKNKTGIYLTKCFGQSYFNSKVSKWLQEEAEERARKEAEERARREAEQRRVAEEKRRDEERRRARR
jgi:hypothetical protein